MSMTQDRYNEGIRRLRRYESTTLLASEYSRIHGQDLGEAKAKAISHCIKQGRELFESASTSDYMTKPIELYYGMSALDRSMLLMANHDLQESDLEHNHGLQLVPLPDRVDSASQLLEIPVVFKKGEFTQWYSEAQDYFVMRINRSEADWRLGYDTELTGKSVTLGQLLTLIPDVWIELNLATDIPLLPKLRVTGYSTDSKTVSFDGEATNEQVEACFPGIESGKVSGLNNINWNVSTQDMPDFVPQFAQENEDGFSIGSAFVVPPIGDIRLSPLACYIAVAYSMSMLARYRPSIWGAMWTGAVADELVPLFERLMHVMQLWSPTLFTENMKALEASETPS